MKTMRANRRAARKTRSGKRGSSLTPREMERNMGYRLLRRGLSKREVAATIGVSWVSADRWLKQLEAKQVRKRDMQRVGRPRKLSSKQLATLKRILKKGALCYGYPTELWTLKRVAEVIKEEFGVKYNVTHIWRVMRSLGFSAQVPLLKAIERDENAIREWISVNWPQIVEIAQLQNAAIFFYDEGGVQSQPNVRRTWSQRGRRPEIVMKQSNRDKLAIISAVTWDGELYFSVHGHDLTDEDTVRFLRKLMKEMSGRKFFVLWDSLKIHRSKRVKRFLEKNAEKVNAWRFPPYAPELNPDEQVWNLAKHDDLANWSPLNKRDLRHVVMREMRTLKSQKKRVASAIRHAKIPLPPIQNY
jgi:transposase